MPNPTLSADQLALAHQILSEVRADLSAASNGDPLVLFALRRKVQKELMYDERGKPAHRNKIKTLKRIEQNELCPICDRPLPAKNAVLDRYEAWKGYTVENARLIHSECDQAAQAAKGYS